MSRRRDSSTRVAEQYEAYPYPNRSPEDEDERLIRTNLDDLGALNCHGFGGRGAFGPQFRALVAGGGTGDALIFLAEQLRGTGATLVYLDQSRAASRIARARARRRGLDDAIEWVHGSLLDLPSMDVAPFDYINCSGVLHHLDDAGAGLSALTAVLAEDGVIGLMVYGRYGRTGVYQMQEAIRLLAGDADELATRAQLAREVIARAPTTNWLKRHWGGPPPRFSFEDAELVDMFLHARDRPFSVPELYDLLDGAGLHLLEFTPEQRLLYQPEYFIGGGDDELAQRVAAMGVRQRQAFAELFHGVLAKHIAWVGRRTGVGLRPRNRQAIPFLSHSAAEYGLLDIVRQAGGRPFSIRMGPPGGLQVRLELELGATARRFLEVIDDAMTLSQLFGALVDDPGADIDTASQAAAVLDPLLDQLMACDLVLLRLGPVPCVGGGTH